MEKSELLDPHFKEEENEYPASITKGKKAIAYCQ